MISYSGGIVKEPTKPKNYQEGPWFISETANTTWPTYPPAVLKALGIA